MIEKSIFYLDFNYFRLRTVAIKFIEMLALVLSRRTQVRNN
jgi:hypothetical protein